MLVLSRQRDETIMIGDEVEITIVDIRGDKVRLGISAPARIAVHRKEVYEAIRVENEQAARTAGKEFDTLPSRFSNGTTKPRDGSKPRTPGTLINPRLVASPTNAPPQEQARKRA